MAASIKHNGVLIIGAGLAGLTAGKVLKAAGKKVMVLEASDAVGGRVRTDHLNGFLLDRGFQVLLTAYPETKRFLNYNALDLKPFLPGAIILNQRGINEIGDPFRQPSSLIKTLLSPAGTLADKLRMLRLKLKLSSKTLETIFAEEQITTLAYLKKAGFSERMLSQFFKPFMTGIFLESELKTSSRMFEFVFKMFSEGPATVPAKGMGMISMQMAESLTANELIFNESVISISGGDVQTASGNIYSAAYIILATDSATLPHPFNRVVKKQNSVVNLYFTANKAPIDKPIIALNALPNKIVNNIAVMDQVSSNYAPEGKSLISISLIGDYQGFKATELARLAIDELSLWYPEAVKWELLKTYYIPFALPNDENVSNDIDAVAMRLDDHCFVCGDYLLNGSINAAMKSGRLAAEGLLTVMS